MKVKEHTKHIAEELTNGLNKDDYETEDNEEPTAHDYLQDALDIRYLISGNGEYLGAEVLVAFGGPNIWIHTREEVVRGYWWGDKSESNYTDNIGLDDACQEYYECTK